MLANIPTVTKFNILSFFTPLTLWLETFNPNKGYAAKYRYRKGLDVYALVKRE